MAAAPSRWLGGLWRAVGGRLGGVTASPLVVAPARASPLLQLPLAGACQVCILSWVDEPYNSSSLRT